MYTNDLLNNPAFLICCLITWLICMIAGLIMNIISAVHCNKDGHNGSPVSGIFGIVGIVLSFVFSPLGLVFGIVSALFDKRKRQILFPIILIIMLILVGTLCGTIWIGY